MVDEKSRVGGLAGGGDVPPVGVAVGLPFRHGLPRGAILVGAPEIGAANEFGLNLFRQKTADVRRVFLQFLEAVHDELIVLRIRFVEPIDVCFVQPAFLAKMLFDFAEIDRQQAVVFGRAFLEAEKNGRAA